MNSTARRVPRITGFPARILGSMTMRSDGGITTVCRVLGRFGTGSPGLRRPGLSWSGRQPGQQNRCNKSVARQAAESRRLKSWPDRRAPRGVYSTNSIRPLNRGGFTSFRLEVGMPPCATNPSSQRSAASEICRNRLTGNHLFPTPHVGLDTPGDAAEHELLVIGSRLLAEDLSVLRFELRGGQIAEAINLRSDF